MQYSRGLVLRRFYVLAVFTPQEIYLVLNSVRPRWRSWLRHCTTSQKVAGSIPDGVIGIFH